MKDNDLEVMLNNVSIPRMNEYVSLGFSLGTEELLESYFSIQEVSSHFFVPIQILEICLRNSLSTVLSNRFDETAANLGKDKWYEILPISEKSRDAVRDAKKNASDKTKGNYTDGDVVSRLTFGFWVYLLEPVHNNNRQNPYHFWQYEIDNVFPGRGDRKIANIFDKLKQINTKRNRLYHHEPIWKKKKVNSFDKAISSLDKEYNILNDAIGWVSPAKKDYMEKLGYKARFDECCEKHLKR